MRHAEAALPAPGTNDHERPLTERGTSRTEILGKRLSASGMVPDHILSSDAERAVQTARHLLKGARQRRPVMVLLELYDCQPEEMLEAIATFADPAVRHLMVVGHNPAIAMLAEQLAAGSPGTGSALEEFHPGSAAVFAVHSDGWQRLRASSMTLETVHHPAEYA